MKEDSLFSVHELTVAYATPKGPLKALDAVSFSIAPGETLALVGESGSGKSSVALAAMGLLGPEARVSGEVRLQGRDLTRLPPEELRRVRGAAMSIVFQDPFTSLNPALPIGLQVAEPLVFHNGMGPDAARERATAALAEVGLPNAASLLSAYPHQLSGGMRQRVLIATALVCDPTMIIMDEPTTALDATVEARILDLLEDIRRRRRLSMLFITHNLGLVNRIADRVCVLYAGRIAEIGAKNDVLRQPLHPYTKGLLACVPQLGTDETRPRLSSIAGRSPDLTQSPRGCIFAARCAFADERCVAQEQILQPMSSGHAVRCFKAASLIGRPWPSSGQASAHSATKSAALDTRGAVIVDGVSKSFTVRAAGGIVWKRRFGVPLPRLASRELRAVDGVSFTIWPREVLGLVGESGSGKSTLGRLVLRLVEPTRGQVLFHGRNIAALRSGELKKFRSQAQIVFQNPDSSLNPRRTIGQAIARAVELHADVPSKQICERVETLLQRVGLPPFYADRYPHQLSGGEKQRVGIARALATGPAFLVCDEPVSALDVSVQATVLNLLADLRDDLGLSYLFISHDLSVVAHLADRIAVMFAGRIVELGSTRAVLEPPYHPYTEALLSAAPQFANVVTQERPRATLRPDCEGGDQRVLGCPFQARCLRKVGAICETETPPVRLAGRGHSIACHIPLAELAAVPSVVATKLARRPGADPTSHTTGAT